MAEKIEKKMINVRLNPALWARAKAAAGEHGTTLERWVTAALEAELDREAQAKSGTAGAGVAGATAAERDLAWRVAALEEAVDYLASTMGASLPGISPAATPALGSGGSGPS